MEIEDEINQINSIINKLDVIRDDEWQKKEDETEEEFDNRLEAIEEELEEELLDYISDSLLAAATPSGPLSFEYSPINIFPFK